MVHPQLGTPLHFARAHRWSNEPAVSELESHIKTFDDPKMVQRALSSHDGDPDVQSDVYVNLESWMVWMSHTHDILSKDKISQYLKGSQHQAHIQKVQREKREEEVLARQRPRQWVLID